MIVNLFVGDFFENLPERSPKNYLKGPEPMIEVFLAYAVFTKGYKFITTMKLLEGLKVLWYIFHRCLMCETSYFFPAEAKMCFLVEKQNQRTSTRRKVDGTTAVLVTDL